MRVTVSGESHGVTESRHAVTRHARGHFTHTLRGAPRDATAAGRDATAAAAGRSVELLPFACCHAALSSRLEPINVIVPKRCLIVARARTHTHTQISWCRISFCKSPNPHAPRRCRATAKTPIPLHTRSRTVTHTGRQRQLAAAARRRGEHRILSSTPPIQQPPPPSAPLQPHASPIRQGCNRLVAAAASPLIPRDESARSSLSPALQLSRRRCFPP